jgi:type IX secretion system PorP/SprF family membrane protein
MYLTSTAQQPTNITHYMFTNLLNNPAVAGSNEGICVTALIRQQWYGFKDNWGGNTAPQNMYVSVDAPLKFLHGGVGASVLTDKIGQENHTDVRVDYAYRTELGSGDLSVGAQLDIMNTKINSDDFHFVDEGDDVKTNLGKDDLVLDMGLGLSYKVPDKFYIGISGINLLQSKEDKIYYRLKRSYFLTCGYNWVLPNHPLFELQPSALIRYDGGSYSIDITGLVLYNKKVYGGLAYRLQESISVLVGVAFKNFRIGVAYDASMIGAFRKNSGGLEIMGNYCFKISTEKFRKSYRNTRFL